jgi:CRP/FNR family cyclic AMP-dependent transcriptional regulator
MARTAFHTACSTDAVSQAYNLTIVDNCLVCKLRHDRFFCALPKASLEALEQLKYPSLFPKGSLIFLEGQSPRGIYILCQGRVKLSMTARDGKTLILGIVEPGDVLGLHATITGSPYELTAETLLPSQLNFVARPDFLRFLKEHGAACLRTAQHLSDSCQSAYELIRSIGLSHQVAERLAKLLLGWSTQGEHNGGAIYVKRTMTHEEIAQLIGASRETVTRLLSQWKKDHIAQVSGAGVLIHNKAALERLVSSF